MRTKQFWVDALERAAKTAAQFVLATGVADQANVLELDWSVVGGAAAMGAALSLLTSVASSAVGDPATASLVGGTGRHRRA